ncbi:amidohydrolase family protein [Streptomyces aureoverticillatus]|uniref:amidohydrolase family protein n=1 Tax=Streptomyces aureoverticillatus TaxID=66871 RepID=UPI0013D9BEB7|nr:amidohydrolase family protein [Streptomyces aureoverticillatus]QIB41993.1 amidohydrolase [Streptomyces aureoverticillatus]
MTEVTGVFDGHCHVASTRFIPRAFVEDVASNVQCRLGSLGAAPRPGRVADGLAAQHEDHLADGLVEEMDAAGVERAVLLVPDFGLRMTGTAEPEEAARLHHEIRLRHPGRFWVYIGVDPRRGPEGVVAFERMVDAYGLDGVKLYPPCGYSPSDPGLYPYYEICADRALPVFVHTGPTARSLDYGPAHPMRIDRAARDFPDIPFVLGHGGLTHVDTCAYLAAYRPNVYVDTGGFASGPSLPYWPEHLNRLFRMGINHKIIFGTDWPLGRLNGGLKGLMGEVVDGPTVFAGVSRTDRNLLLRENLLRVLAPGSRPAE